MNYFLREAGRPFLCAMDSDSARKWHQVICSLTFHQLWIASKESESVCDTTYFKSGFIIFKDIYLKSYLPGHSRIIRIAVLPGLCTTSFTLLYDSCVMDLRTSVYNATDWVAQTTDLRSQNSRSGLHHVGLSWPSVFHLQMAAFLWCLLLFSHVFPSSYKDTNVPGLISKLWTNVAQYLLTDSVFSSWRDGSIGKRIYTEDPGSP